MPTSSLRRGRGEESLMDKIKAKQKLIEDNRGMWWKPEEKKNRVRVMPSWSGPRGLWYKEIITHYEVGPEKKSCACLKPFEQSCPVCMAVERLCDSSKVVDQKLASDMMARSIYVVNVGVPNAPDGLVKVWRMGEPFFLLLLGMYTDGENGDFSHPRTGYDITFVRKGSGLSTRYSNVLPTRPKPLEIEDWKPKLKNLDIFVKPYTRSEMRAFLAGEDLD